MRAIPFPHLLPLVLACGFVAVTAGISSAEEITYPYRARVVVDEAEVRSGPGRRYYATSNITRNQAVSVHRRDPGGWLMIAPPEGSFSWVLAENIRQAENRGTVIKDDTVVRVGSSVQEAWEVEQRRLAIGETVTILGERTVESDSGSQTLLKILPPDFEYRWIESASVLPIDARDKQAQAADPFAMPVVEGTPDPFEPPPFSEELAPEPIAAETGGTGNNPDPDAPSAEEIADSILKDRPRPDPQVIPAAGQSDPVAEAAAYRREIRERIAELDDQFRGEIAGEIGHWNFDDIELGYREVLEVGVDGVTEASIKTRLRILGEHRERRAEYDRLMNLVRETDRRDAELRKQQRTGNETAPRRMPSRTAPNGRLDDSRIERPTPRADRAVTPASASRPVPTPKPATTAATRTADGSPFKPTPAAKFTGAGIVQQIIPPKPNGPRFALVTKDHRVIAYLVPGPNINLQAAIGREMGVLGPRSHQADLHNDVIRVHRITPVRLSGQ